MENKFITYYEKPKKYKQINTSTENKKEEKENKEFYTKSHYSSDLTSFSFSTTEAFSQTSENSYIPSDLRSSNKLNIEKNRINYFSDVIDHFKKAEPEKFSEYKNSKNFIPKRKKEKIEYTNYTYNNINMPYNNNNVEENEMIPINYIQFANNTYNNIINGNIIYYIYNNFFFNYQMNKFQPENDINKANDKEENEDNKTPENESQDEKKNDSKNIEEKIETNKNDDIEIIKVRKKFKKNVDNIDDNYFTKKRNYKNYNNKTPINENKEIEIECYEGNRHRKKKDYHLHEEQFDMNTYSNNYKGKFKQHGFFNKGNGNGNCGGRRKNFFDENRFYKRKYHQQMYY